MKNFLLLGVLCAFLGLQDADAQESKVFEDHFGSTIAIQLGTMAFADEVVAFNQGYPSKYAEHPRRNAKLLLGAPNYTLNQNKPHENTMSLGCHGSIILKFNDNALVDMAGPDLMIFEVGDVSEPMAIELSEDGVNWIKAGKVHGHTTSLDIAPFVERGAVINYVKIIDLAARCDNYFCDGADIDAVAALNSIPNRKKYIRQYKQNAAAANTTSLANNNGVDTEAYKNQSNSALLNIQNFEVYPNPVQHLLTIAVALEKEANLNIALFDAAGKQIKTLVTNGQYGAGNHQFTLPLTQLPNGMYFVQVNTPDGSMMKKVIKN